MVLLDFSLLLCAFPLINALPQLPPIVIPKNEPPIPVNPINGYKSTGTQKPLVKPYTPAGGLNTTAPPVYHPLSDFDFHSLNLALYQEWIELDLFRYALEVFPVSAFEEAGLRKDDRDLISFMADQEVGHSTLISNILGPRAAKPCKYRYPFKTVREFIDFSQKLTRWGESGVYGFLEKLDSRDSATLLLQSITTEARQQMIFRQFEGLFPMPVWFETGVTQSMAWTLLSRYIVSCPRENGKLAWANFPALDITNNPSGIAEPFGPSITTDRTPLSYSGREVKFAWEKSGKKVGPDHLYTTDTVTKNPPKFAAWVSQLNVTYTPLYDINYDCNTGKARQPKVNVFPGLNDPVVNGTMFVALVDQDVYLTPGNISLINDHIVAGPALYQAG